MTRKILILTLVLLLVFSMGVMADEKENVEVEEDVEIEEEIVENNNEGLKENSQAIEDNQLNRTVEGSILDSNIEVYAGLNYNTYSDLKVVNYSYDVPDGDTDDENQLNGYDKGYIEKKTSGFGIYGGFRYWVNERVGIGTEVEHMSATWDLFQQKHVKIDTTGFLGVLSYRVADDLMANFAGGGYKIDAEFPKFNAFGEKLAYGLKASLEGGIPVYDDLNITGRVGYRFLLNPEVDDFEYGRKSFEEAEPYKIETDFSGFEFALAANLSF
ncbi:hypothetical protein MWH25_06065 [Natroniella acetigena]|uniref:hypothetical protein n=1 Tax=Natroniella acetigena TaxID=52004 RepID=UPI00200A69A3|nr:hypothetical protein [Natroniella acetigena]MCK8827306.1 hypothetical protein [Natroniella acetigena]